VPHCTGCVTPTSDSFISSFDAWCAFRFTHFASRLVQGQFVQSMLSLLILIFLEITCFHSNVAALSIMIQPDTIVGQQSLVVWTREPSDGNEQLVFDLRFLSPGPPAKDVGLALANVQASPSTQYGTVKVVFPSAGLYQLVAVSGPNYVNLGKSSTVNAYQIPTSTPTPTPTPTPSSTSQSIPSATTSAKPKTEPITRSAHRTKNVGAIIGGTLGGVVFLGLLAALVIWFLRRRQPIDDKRWSFHRHMMVRPPVLDISHTSPTGVNISDSSPEDIERGLPHEAIPSSSIVMTTSPSEPRLELPSQPLPDLPPGEPHQEGQMEQGMMELEKNPGPTQHITFV